MLRDRAGLSTGEEASMLADLAHLTPEPAGLASLLVNLGYVPHYTGTGLFAPGSADLPVLLFPLYAKAGLAVRKRRLVGRSISRSGTLAAGLAALRSTDQRPPLLFLVERQELPAGIRPEQVVSLEGGVVPRIWRGCFGSFDAMLRITGQRPHPGLANHATNAIEGAVPILQAMLHLKTDMALRMTHRRHTVDAPLQPRLTVHAAHGGSAASGLPVTFDILLNRRYDPAENLDAAVEEIREAVSVATPRSVQAEISIRRHAPPVPDPDAPTRSREERALAAGWGWPQVRFCRQSTLMPGATVMGGLEHAGAASEAEDAFTSLDDMAALSRTVRALLQEG